MISVCTCSYWSRACSTCEISHVTSNLLCCRYLCVVPRRIYKTQLVPSVPWWSDHVIRVEVVDSGERENQGNCFTWCSSVTWKKTTNYQSHRFKNLKYVIVTKNGFHPVGMLQHSRRKEGKPVVCFSIKIIQLYKTDLLFGERSSQYNYLSSCRFSINDMSLS